MAARMPNEEQADPRRVLIYEEALRGWFLQSSVLDELRNRTGILLSAASVSAAFLGAADVDRHRDFTWLGYSALGVFVIAIALAVSVLWPAKWTFTNDAAAMTKEYVESGKPLDFMYEDVAKETEKYRAENQTKLDCRFALFQWACIAVGLDVTLWLVDLTRVVT